jgi:8-oxo-dGTP pyrophosphatase MutT (NUDIX family)
MRWTVHSERSVYESPWLGLHLADIEMPGGGPRFDAHVVRFPVAAVGTVVVRPADGAILLLWRHRWATDTWGWEIPAGRAEEGESAVTAAVRETTEETGWRPLDLAPLLTYYPAIGSSDLRFHLFRATAAEHVGEPVDTWEAERVEWLPPASVHAAISGGDITSGMTLTGLLYHFTGPIPDVGSRNG